MGVGDERSYCVCRVVWVERRGVARGDIGKGGQCREVWGWDISVGGEMRCGE